MSREETFGKLKKFVEEHEVSRKATTPIKNGAEVEIHIKGDPQVYAFKRVGKRSLLTTEAPEKPDFRLDFPPAVIDELVASDSDDVGLYGVKIFEYSIASDPEMKIDTQIYVGFFTLMKHGYFGMLRLGGRVLLELLKRYELHKPANVRKIVKKLSKK